MATEAEKQGVGNHPAKIATDAAERRQKKPVAKKAQEQEKPSAKKAASK